MIINRPKPVILFTSLLSILTTSLTEKVFASDKRGYIPDEKEKFRKNHNTPKNQPIKNEPNKKAQNPKKPSPSINFHQIKELEGVVKVSSLPWIKLEPALNGLFKETLSDPSYEKRTFRFDVQREDWESFSFWRKAIFSKAKYPVSFTFSNKGVEGERINGIYALCHIEISLNNFTKKEEEARNSFAYRFFEGELDQSCVNFSTFYNLMVRAGFTEEDFKQGKHGYQDKIFVKSIKVKNQELPDCDKEIQDMIESHLEKALQPYVAFIFELPPAANFKVQDLTFNSLDDLALATIIEESEKRLYLCFSNDKRTRLDLHKKSSHEAFESVKTFIQERHAHYDDSCTIITGRGNHANSNGTRGVIFSELPRWMKDEEICPLVKRFVQKEGLYTIFLKKPAECDLRKLNPEQNPCEIVCDALKKVIKTKDLRLRIKVETEGFDHKLLHFLLLLEPELWQEISPLSMESSSGELRLNLRTREGTGPIIICNGSKTKGVETPSILSSKEKPIALQTMKKDAPAPSPLNQNKKASPNKKKQQPVGKKYPQKPAKNPTKKEAPPK